MAAGDSDERHAQHGAGGAKAPGGAHEGPAPDPVPDVADAVAQRLLDGEELAAARKALSTMRRGEREVFTLCVWEGLDAATVAEALGVAIGTVRARLSRARKRLRKLTELELDGGAGGTQGGTGQRGRQRPAADGQIPGGRHQAARSTQEKR